MSQPRNTALAESITIDMIRDDHEPSTMCAAFQRVVAARAGEIALRTAGGGRSYTWAQYAERVALIAGGLAARGVRRGDAVALLLTNRPEFHFVDTAAQHLGAAPFSCYNTSSPEQLGYLLKASGARVAVTERLLAPAIQRFLDDPESPLSLLILVDGPRMGEDGGGNDAPPAEEVGDGEDGGGNDAPPAETDAPPGEEISDGEDGGGNDTPPAEETEAGEDGGGNDAPPAERIERGEDGGGNDEPQATARVVGLDEIAVPGFDLAAAAEAAETAAAIDADGWLHTGDVATRDEDGFLRIVDRKKELLITEGGKNIAPAGVELALRTHCPLLAQAVVIGDARPYLVALLVLDPEAVAMFAAVHGIPAADPMSLSDQPVIRAAVSAGVQAANATLSRVGHIRAYEVLPEVWLPGGDLVTPTMKVRRRAVLQQYADRVDALYAAR